MGRPKRQLIEIEVKRCQGPLYHADCYSPRVWAGGYDSPEKAVEMLLKLAAERGRSGDIKNYEIRKVNFR